MLDACWALERDLDFLFRANYGAAFNFNPVRQREGKFQ